MITIFQLLQTEVTILIVEEEYFNKQEPPNMIGAPIQVSTKKLWPGVGVEASLPKHTDIALHH